MSFYHWMRTKHMKTPLFKEMDEDEWFPWDRSIDVMLSHVGDVRYRQLSDKWAAYIDDTYDYFALDL